MILKLPKWILFGALLTAAGTNGFAQLRTEGGVNPGGEPRLSAGGAEDHAEFSKVSKSMHNPALLEKAKILYLINRIKFSSYRFERNGIAYEGSRAASHLLMKYTAVKDRIETAEQFVLYIAAGSSLSGRPYYILKEDGTRHPSRAVLLKELSLLEERLAEAHASKA